MGWLTEAGPDASPSLRLWVAATNLEARFRPQHLKHRVLVDPHCCCPLQKRLHPRPMQALLCCSSPRIAPGWITAAAIPALKPPLRT